MNNIIKMLNGQKKQQYSMPAVVTIEFRAQKRNQLADLILANSVLKDINEQTIMMRVKELENNIYSEHAANIHLYSNKIEKVLSLFKGINLNNYIYIAQKLRKSDLNLKTINKLLEQKKKLKDYDQTIQTKQTQVKKTEYDPLNTNKQSIPKIAHSTLVTQKVTITKPKQPTQSCSFVPQQYLVFSDILDPKEPVQEKKVKIQQDSEDEIDIRINDGMQGAAVIGVYCSKPIILHDQKIKIPVHLLVAILPLYRVLNEKIDFSKQHPAKDTINFLQQNQDRKIIFGQVILRPCEQYSDKLKELSDCLVKQDKIIAQKYDNGNATFIILHKNQLELILKSRKQSMPFDASDMVIKEWAKQQSYIEWWALNKQNHDLHFLISYKAQTNTSEHIYDKVILQKPSCYPKIQQIIDQQLQKKDIDDLLQGFLTTDILQNQIFSIDTQQNQNIPQLEIEKIAVSQENDLPDYIPPNVEHTNKYNIKISDLTLQLQKEDYF